jgi:hypothetical protein
MRPIIRLRLKVIKNHQNAKNLALNAGTCWRSLSSTAMGDPSYADKEEKRRSGRDAHRPEKSLFFPFTQKS